MPMYAAVYDVWVYYGWVVHKAGMFRCMSSLLIAPALCVFVSS